MGSIQDESANRRTLLAGERTALAWWRTGLTALAVAIGIGRVVPELQASSTTWPYLVVGIGFALYGLALFVEGSARGRQEAAELGEQNRAASRVGALLVSTGPVLCVAVIALIAFA